MALLQLLKLCFWGRRDEALALLDHHNLEEGQGQGQAQGQAQGGGLLEQPWEGGVFAVEDKWVWPGDRALHAASKGGSPELVLALLLRGADIHARGNGGMDALMHASYYDHVAAATVLLDRGADVLARDDEQRTALHLAAMKDKPEMCDLLLSRGSDLTAVNRDNQTSLDMYGRNANPRPSPAERVSRLARLEAAWSAGPHPSQVQRRRDEAWARRWPVVLFVTGCRFRPLAGKQGWVPPPEGLSLEQRERARRRSLVFSSDVLLRLIVGFL